MALKYQRILLKISGEALGGEKGTGFDEPTMDAICGGVKKAHELGVQIGIVVRGGNTVPQDLVPSVEMLYRLLREANDDGARYGEQAELEIQG